MDHAAKVFAESRFMTRFPKATDAIAPLYFETM